MSIASATGTERVVTSLSHRQHAVEVLESTHDHAGRLLLMDSEPRELPSDLADVLNRVLAAMAHGGTIVIGSLPDELSTVVAAEQLGISRPTLMKMIRSGEIPAHKVGSHHRLKAADVLAARRARLERQRVALDELLELEAQVDQ